MKFYLAVFLLVALCTLAFAQEDEWTATNWTATLGSVNENGTFAGRPGNRIIGGKEAFLGLIPYQASILLVRNGINILCGGSLISSGWVVTTAYCIQGGTTIRVRLGNLLYSSGGQVITGSTSYVYPNYNSAYLTDNIGLIKLSAYAVINNYVQPIRIADSSLNFINVRASGWGTMSNGQGSVTLRYADLANLDVNQCARAYYPGIVTTNALCTVSPIGESACGQDLGGPLIDINSRQLVGIISFTSPKGCFAGAPTGYVRVANYRTWIRSVTGISNI